MIVRRTQKQLDDLRNSTGNYRPNPLGIGANLPALYDPHPPERDHMPIDPNWNHYDKAAR